VVVDPFAGSNTTGAVGEKLRRRWLAFEVEPKYVKGSRVRFALSEADNECSEFRGTSRRYPVTVFHGPPPKTLPGSGSS